MAKAISSLTTKVPQLAQGKNFGVHFGCNGDARVPETKQKFCMLKILYPLSQKAFKISVVSSSHRST